MSEHTNSTVFVVDDEPSIVTLLQFNLEQAGYKTITAEDGPQALQVIQQKSEAIDLIILDVMLPGMDGIEVCKRIRQEGLDIPVLMLTAKDDELDKIIGLELGADDYITKPFSPREVVARVKAVLRRTKRSPSDQRHSVDEEALVIGRLRIIPDNFEVFYDGQQLELTPKEFELLVHLSRHVGRVLTREQLLNAVWDYDFVGDTRIVDVHISHLRDKIDPRYIKTIRGLGYKMEGPTGDGARAQET